MACSTLAGTPMPRSVFENISNAFRIQEVEVSPKLATITCEKNLDESPITPQAESRLDASPGAEHRHARED